MTAAMPNQPRQSQFALSVMLIGLSLLCLIWESVGAPLRAGGSGLMIKAVFPLLFVLGSAKQARRTLQVLSFFILLYIFEGSMRVLSDTTSASRWFAAGELVLSVLIFVTSLKYLRAQNKKDAALNPRQKPSRKKTSAAQYVIALCVIWAVFGSATNYDSQAYMPLAVALILPLVASIFLSDRAAVLFFSPLIALVGAWTLMAAPADNLWVHKPFAWGAILIAGIGFLINLTIPQRSTPSPHQPPID